MTEHVTILGDGAMATVAAIVLDHNGHRVTMWGARSPSIERLLLDREQHRLLPGVRVPESVNLTADDRRAFDDATLILSAVPTQYMREVWTRLRPFVPEGVPVVSVSKGIENGTLFRPTQIIEGVLRPTCGGPSGGTPTVSQNPPATGRVDPKDRGGANQLAVLSGPNIAGEIARRHPATAVVAAADTALAHRVQSAMSTPWFRIYTNTDVIGVEIAGATKNVIAIAAGMLDGLEAGNNAKAALVTRGLVEISRLAMALGADAATLHGLAGLGDLITTCVSPEGRNRSVGEKIGRGATLDDVLAEMSSVAEGVPTTKAVHELARQRGVEMPITDEVFAILFDGKNVLSALTDLMTREPKPEWIG